MELAKKLEPTWFDHEDAGFLCKPLTAAQKLSAYSAIESGDYGEAYARMVRSAVVDWRGIVADGAAVKFSLSALDDLFSDERNASLLMNLGTFIANRARVSDPKKS